VRQLEIERQMDADAIASVSVLLAEAERADGHKPLSDHLWLDLVSGGRAGFVGVIAHDASGQDDGEDRGQDPHQDGRHAPIAYAQASRANASWMIELVVAPARRGDLFTIGRDLIGAILDVIAADGGGRVDWIVI
jgi:hypothetical protein